MKNDNQPKSPEEDLPTISEDTEGANQPEPTIQKSAEVAKNTLDEQQTEPNATLPAIPEAAASASSAKRFKKNLIIIPLILLVLAVAAAAVYLFVLRRDPEITQAPVSTSELQTPEPEPIGTPIPETTLIARQKYIEPVFIDLDVTWQQPSNISLLGYYKNEVQFTDTPKPEEQSETHDDSQKQITYMLAGTFSGGRIIYANWHNAGLGGTIDVFLVRTGENPILLERYTTPVDYNTNTSPESRAMREEQQRSTYADTVKFDKTTIIKGTWAPESIQINGQPMTLPKYEYVTDASETKTYAYNTGFYPIGINKKQSGQQTLIETRPEGKLFEIVQKKEGYYLSLYELELPNFFRVSYELGGEISASDIQPITWTDGNRNLDSYETFGYGCGGGSYSLVANLTLNDLIQIGTSDGSQKIYSFKDLTQPVAATILSEVNSRGGPSIWINPETDPPYTAEEFIRDRAVIIVQDAMNRWIIFKNSKNFVRGGCAKPVIYLYPEEPTTLNVAVGAEVTISEPFYEPGGWQNVTALPNGQLFYRGLPYESLFWEGQGHGTYPDKSGYGVVVKRSDVISTLTAHMYAQGFNQKETDDFLEFWELNIPSGPYVRITWLDTAEMNQLAPLRLSVQPDTVIRTFVELEGLSEPITLKPQTFRAPERRGFTLTEWGGLAENGLQSLVYPD